MKTNKTRYLVALLLGAVLMALAVSGLSEANRTIVIEGVEPLLYVGEKTTAKATVESLSDEAPSKTTIVWSSSDKEVATVDSKGNIKAVSAGTAVITATAKDDESITASLDVNIVIPVSAIQLNSDKENLLLSDERPEWAQVSLTAGIEPVEAYCQDVVWSSSDEAIATVDENGNVQAHAIGKVTITATSVQKALDKKGPKSASCTIEVDKPVESISLSETDLHIAKGKTAKLSAEVFPEDATDRSVTWYSANPQIVSIEKGSLKAKACGSCDVFCIANDGSEVEAAFTVHVEQAATGIQFEDKSITMYLGDQVPVSYTVVPEDTTDPSVSWRSSDHLIVTISSQGLMTPLGTGKCTITAYTNDGSGKSASFTVFVPTITPLVESEITLNRLADAYIQYETHGTQGEDIYIDNIDVCDLNVEEMDEETGRMKKLRLIPKKVGTTVVTVADAYNQSEGSFKVKVHVTRDVLFESDAVFSKTMSTPLTSAEKSATADLYCGTGLTRALFTVQLCVDYHEAQSKFDINMQYPSYVINPENGETLYLLCRGEKQTTLLKYSFVTKEGAYYTSNSIDDFDYLKTLYESFGYTLYRNQMNDLAQAVEMLDN